MMTNLVARKGGGRGALGVEGRKQEVNERSEKEQSPTNRAKNALFTNRNPSLSAIPSPFSSPPPILQSSDVIQAKHGPHAFMVVDSDLVGHGWILRRIISSGRIVCTLRVGRWDLEELQLFIKYGDLARQIHLSVSAPQQLSAAENQSIDKWKGNVVLQH